MKGSDDILTFPRKMRMPWRPGIVGKAEGNIIAVIVD